MLVPVYYFTPPLKYETISKNLLSPTSGNCQSYCQPLGGRLWVVLFVNPTKDQLHLRFREKIQTHPGLGLPGSCYRCERAGCLIIIYQERAFFVLVYRVGLAEHRYARCKIFSVLHLHCKCTPLHLQWL